MRILSIGEFRTKMSPQDDAGTNKLGFTSGSFNTA